MTNLQRFWRGIDTLVISYDEYIDESNIELAQKAWEDICTCLDFALSAKLINNKQYRALCNIMFQARWKEDCFTDE